MNYRALFIGGPIDGQERVLRADFPHINVSIGQGKPTVTYALFFAFGSDPKTLIYSLWDIEETLNRVWRRYAGEEKPC